MFPPTGPYTEPVQSASRPTEMILDIGCVHWKLFGLHQCSITPASHGINQGLFRFFELPSDTFLFPSFLLQNTEQNCNKFIIIIMYPYSVHLLVVGSTVVTGVM